MPEPLSPFKRVRRAFNPTDLKRICEMHETEFAERYKMQVTVDEHLHRGDEYADFHAYLDNGADILAVAHLDTVVSHASRTCNFLDTKAGPVVHSGALDDRLGAYTILELLPALGIKVDVLLTTGEETGSSTASCFEPSKEYNWAIEFDRGGTDVVLYQYGDGPGGKEAEDLVRACGARVASGSFSDISYLEHLEVKAFNWGVGYQDYHSTRGYAYLEDYWKMIGYWLKFHEANATTYLPHENLGLGMSRHTSSLWPFPEQLCDNEDCGEVFEPYHSSQVLCDNCEWEADRETDDRNYSPRVEDLPDISEYVDAYAELVSEDPVVVSKALATMDATSQGGMPGRSLN